jgi:molybdopterin-binding protein
MNISTLLSRRPSTLSGGELQRVALARTLIHDPKILLLDEPLASLDIQLKSELRGLLRRMNRSGQTIIHVTHDYEEAVSLGNAIAIIYNGTILQTGTPEEVFQHPGSEFVAHFTGAKNFFRARAITNGECGNVLVNEKVTIRINGIEENADGYIMIRNEDIFLSRTEVDTSAINNFRGTVNDIIPSRSGVEILVDIGILLHVTITRDSLHHLDLRENEPVWVHFKATAVRFIKKQNSKD